MIRVTKNNKCPICDHDSWCYFTDDMTMVICMRVESKLKAKNGGNIHILKERDTTEKPYVPPPPTRLKKFDAEKYHAKLRSEWDHVMLDGTALSLGVSEESLERLQVAYDNFSKAFAYPMRDADGKVVGIRLRNFVGKKWAIGGTSDGLFYDPDLQLSGDRELVVCEGPTDTAAAYSLGLSAVGRSSCGTGGDLLRALCARLGAKLVTIIADNDGWREVADNLHRPGLDGAVALGKRLGRMHRIVITPKKDLRRCVNDGWTIKEFRKHADVSIKKLA